MNGLTLAYIGDAYYELSVRTHLIQNKITNVNDLHKKAIKFTAGTAQSLIIIKLMEENLLSTDEIETFKRGRNSSGPGRKNIDAKTYHYATGFEALIGFLYLHDKNRADELIRLAIIFIEKGDFNGKDS
ncbi:MAG: ribonuclease III domain-containing protein [Acholeplasmataceae bacterium]|nr:ribonuclease III domain-containing protein [Acholeplasmataceae bacterium]